jgi:DNA-binding SARP family transcriptional activator
MGRGRAREWGKGRVSATELDSAGLGKALIFERFPYGLVLVERDGEVLYLNRRARRLLSPAQPQVAGRGWRCCDLICNRLEPVVGSGCLTQRARAAEGPLPEVRMDIEQDRLQAAAWITASKIDRDGGQLLFHLRPGRVGDRRRRTPPEWSDAVRPADLSRLQILTLGRFRVEGPGGPLNGDWLDQRPGELLKYLVSERRRVLPSDRIAEALWPEAGIHEARNRLRHYVHALRDRLEPERGHRSPTQFVVAHRGAYRFDTSAAWIDADVFEREARAGLSSFERGASDSASAHLVAARRLYQGDFLSEDPYAEWALDERERLRELAGRVLRAQVSIAEGAGDLEAAADHARQLAAMEPYDHDVQKLFIALCLKRGRRSEALRRYGVLRKRLLTEFNRGPDFELADLERR